MTALPWLAYFLRTLDFVELDPATLGPGPLYHLLIGGVVPRPIAWVSTIDAQGRTNLAPFSFFNAVSSQPPALVFSVAAGRGGRKKDTLRGIEDTRQFVVHSAGFKNAADVNQSAGEYPEGVSEIETIGLETLPSVKVKPPRIKTSAIHWECELIQLVPVGDGREGSSTLVIGRIVYVHVAKSVYPGGQIDLRALDPLSRLGGNDYGRTTGAFELKRPKV